MKGNCFILGIIKSVTTTKNHAEVVASVNEMVKKGNDYIAQETEYRLNTHKIEMVVFLAACKHLLIEKRALITGQVTSASKLFKLLDFTLLN